MSDVLPETPEQIRELLVHCRAQVPDAKDLEFHTAPGAPDFLILGYLVHNCGIARSVVREQCVAIGWTEAVESLDSWTSKYTPDSEEEHL